MDSNRVDTSDEDPELLARLQDALAGRYTIARRLGYGATAFVYLARDMKHDRLVALKLLRPELSAHIAAERFLREIRVAATLQHPHILALYDSGEANGLLYYVMPYVAGESLRARLERDVHLPIDEALMLIRALAGALDYAHRQDVIHRDIKPENILLQEGHPLLADFGLALAIRSAGGHRLTASGLSVGTPLYMSPEQATADRVLGPQSDIYSLAAVAYETLAGEPPFAGRSVDAIRARVVLEPPRPIRIVRDTVPEGAETAILRALAKVPADRFRTAGEFAAALTARAPVRLLRFRKRSLIRSIPLIAATMVVAALIARFTSRSPFPRASIQRQLTFSGKTLNVAISPDGQFLAYAVKGDSLDPLIVQDLAGGSPDTLASLPDVTSLQWSPDGARLLVGSYDAARASGLALIVHRSGGPVRRVNAANRVVGGISATWLPDGRRVSICCDTAGRPIVANLETDSTETVTIAGDYGWIGGVSWAPDGQRLAAITSSFAGPKAGSELRVAFLDGRAEIVVRDTVTLSAPQWSSASDAIFYARPDGTVWRVRISRRTNRAMSPPEKLHGELEALRGDYNDWVSFSLTRDGRKMVYSKGRRFSNLALVEPTTSGNRSRTVSLTSGTSLRWSPAVSPDGRWIAFAQEVEGGADLFRMPLEGGGPTRITVGARVKYPSYVAWSPDGTRLAFMTARAGRGTIWTADVEGGALNQFDATAMSVHTSHLTWGPGSRIVYQSADQAGLHFLDPVTSEEDTLIVEPRSADASMFWGPQYSPDGRHLAVLWANFALPRETGIWVYKLGDRSRTPILPLWGYWPRGWSADGRYIYLQRASRGSALFRIPAGGAKAPEAFLKTPFRDVECTPVGPTRPNVFVCAAFDFVSDVWMVEGEERGTP
jgi:serine/threonine protein kinase